MRLTIGEKDAGLALFFPNHLGRAGLCERQVVGVDGTRLTYFVSRVKAR